MKAGIMQPYLFPYIGYFQLIKAVDTFVIYDDVQYITRGWVNRNRFLQNGEENLFTFSLKNDSSRKNINQRYFTNDFDRQCKKFLKMIQFAYGNAPHFEETRQMIHRVVKEMNPKEVDENIAVKIGRSIEIISRFLNLDTAFKISSDIEKADDKSGQYLILDINQSLGADTYINPVGGRELYDDHLFIENDITLAFLKPGNVEYAQFSEAFIPWLSIIDVCMFNSEAEISEMLDSYSLVS